MVLPIMKVSRIKMARNNGNTSQRVQVRTIIRSFLRPSLSVVATNGACGACTRRLISRVSDPDPHVFALPGSGQKGKEMNE